MENKRKLGILLLGFGLIFQNCQAQENKKTSVNSVQTEQNQVDNKENLNKKHMGTIQLTKKDFLEKVMNYETNPNEWKYLGDKPCIIDFYADWCGPCKAVAPVLEELAATYAGKINIYKINTDKEQELAAVFGIRSIPSILFVPMNEKPQMSVGALPKQQLIEAIENTLLKK